MKKRVYGEQCRTQCIVGLPFTVYCLPHALRSALSALRGVGSPKSDVFDPDFCGQTQIAQPTRRK